MALLKAEDFLKPEQGEHEIPLDFLEIPENHPTPILIISVSQDVRSRAAFALRKYGSVRVYDAENGGKPYAEPNDDPCGYAKHVLEKAYKDVIDLFDTPSKKAFLALVETRPAFGKAVAGKLTEFFNGDHLLKQRQTEDDKKNSGDI